ncbi:hypothetical protein ACVIRM_005398 [Rhizobium laguerreae]
MRERAIIVVRNDNAIAKAFRRSRLWSPDHFQDRTEMPSLMKIILDETTGTPRDGDEMRKMDEDLEQAYRRTLY